jgi:hypothetical protein
MYLVYSWNNTGKPAIRIGKTACRTYAICSYQIFSFSAEIKKSMGFKTKFSSAFSQNFIDHRLLIGARKNNGSSIGSSANDI